MTYAHEWSPMPHVLAVRCPGCAEDATFEFAERVRIARTIDRAFFERSKLFEVRFDPGSWAGQGGHFAYFFHGLRGALPGIRSLPDGYRKEQWAHSGELTRSTRSDLGVVRCIRCGLRRKHVLAWPTDAWFQITYRRSVLWAFDRETALVLRDHVAGTKRERRRWKAFLMNVPTALLRAGARDEVVKRLDRLLGTHAD